MKISSPEGTEGGLETRPYFGAIGIFLLKDKSPDKEKSATWVLPQITSF